MSKASTGFAFVAGLTIGAAGAWYYLKDKYAKLAEEEIASVKAAYAKREKPTTEEKTVSVVNAAKNMDKGITVHDDCCGGGATLIAAANVARNDLEKAGFNFQNHILFSAQDIEETVALMCYIQLSLLGVAGFVKVGNSLTDPIRNGDSLENYWFTPMYFSDIWHTRRVISQMMDILREERESDDH